MNSLSWLIYAAELSNSISAACAFVVFAAVAGLGFNALGCAMGYNADAWENFKIFWPKTIKYLLPLLIVSVVLPSKTTIYAIAASEMGEKVINTPTAAKAMKALDAWLDRQIAEEKPDAQ